MKDFKFGFEIETCVKLLNLKEELPLYAVYAKISEFFKKQIGEEVKVESEDYSLWSIVLDASVECPKTILVPKPKSCLSKNGLSKEDCGETKFYPIEIISPIFSPTIQTMEKIKMVLFKFFFNDNLVFALNESQGFHIHISHPLLDKTALAKLWCVFEEEIFNLLALERKGNKYTKSLRCSFLDNEYRDEEEFKTFVKSPKNIFSNIDYTMTDYKPLFPIDRYHSLNLSIEDSTHVEFRLFGATLIFQDIYKYLKFCLNFVFFSIKNKRKENSFYDSLNGLTTDQKLIFVNDNFIKNNEILGPVQKVRNI